MDEILKKYRKEMEMKFFSEATIDAYIADIKGFLMFLPDKDVRRIPDEVINYRKFLKENYKASSINRKICTLNNFFKALDIDIKLQGEKIHKMRIKDDFLTDKEYKRLLKFAINEKIKLAMIILANTGIRISELKFIKTENLKSGIVEIENKGKIRNIILSKNLINIIRKYCRENDIRGSIINVSRVYLHNAFKQSAANARGGLKKNKVHAHAFRHLFAVQFLKKNNNNIAALADILGHSSLETTRIYTSLSKRQFQEMLENII